MQLTLLTLALGATTLAAAIPFPGPVAPSAAGAAVRSPPIGGSMGAGMSDGHAITNPAFDPSANLDLDAAAAQAPPAAKGAAMANVLEDDNEGLEGEVDSIGRLFGKRSEDLEEGEEEGGLEKRDPATLTAYIIYCLKHPKLCRKVKVCFSGGWGEVVVGMIANGV